MKDRVLPGTAILAAGVGLGIAGDQLLRADAGPGLNFFLLFAGLAAAAWTVARAGGSPLGREASSWIGVGLLCAAALLWRGSELLRVGAFLGACFAFALPALQAGRAWVRRSGTLDLVEAVAGAGLHAAFGSIRLAGREHWGEVDAGAPGGTARRILRTAIVGALIALVPLVVFGALFISADQVFATIVEDLVRIDLEALAGHALAIGVLSWLTCGYLVGVCSGTRLDGIRGLQPSRPNFGVAEVATALGLVDLLFLGFVAVQFRYLFGGSAWVEVTPGLTYAAYARAGFFQLVAAVALAIPWLLVTHSLLDDRGHRARTVFVAFAGVHLLLLFATVASAVQRMLAYQNAYGLTEERIVVTAILLWLTAVLVWFGTTVFGHRRDRFAFGAVATAFVLLGALQIIDPAGLAARHNLDRIEELGGVDAEHLGSLGADAVPLVVARLGELSEESQCVVAHRLLRSWGPDRPGEWKSFNWSENRARRVAREDLGTLRSLASPAGCGESG